MYTIENRADAMSSEPVLLLKVCDVWIIGITGQRLSLRVRHSPDIYGPWRGWDRRWGGRVSEVGGRPSDELGVIGFREK